MIFLILTGAIFNYFAFNYLNSFAGFVCLTPLLVGIYLLEIKKAKKIKIFLYSSVYGFFSNIVIFLWIFHTVYFADKSFFNGLVSLMFICFILSLFFGIFGLCLTFFFESIFFPFFTSSLWIILEYIKSLIFSGFPWMLAGYSQVKNKTLIQIADLFGIYGISFIVMIFNSLVFLVIVFLVSTPMEWIRLKKIFFSQFGVCLLFIIFCYIYGYSKMSSKFNYSGQIKVGLVQANISPYIKWNERNFNKIRLKYETLTKYLSSISAEILIYSETGYPGIVESPNNFLKDISSVVDSYLLFGAISYQNGDFFNSAILMKGKKICGIYKKHHLVPFGEYVPFRALLEKFSPSVRNLGDFSKGKEGEVIRVNQKLSLGVSICYEAIFPSEIRESVRNGAKILINISEDGWFLKTQAPIQHFFMNVIRAVENRRFLIRVSNNGISGIISPYGEVIKRNNFGEEFVSWGVVDLVNYKSFYTKYGDIFVYICLVVAFLKILREAIS